MNRLLLSALALSACAVTAAAAPPAFSPQRLSSEVKILSSDAFQGRGPATPAETRTVSYMIAQFKAAGVRPGGDLENGQRSWTQAVPLLRSEIVGSPSLTLTENGDPIALTQGKQIALRAPLDGSTSVDVSNLPLVFVGYGVSAPERHWDDYKGVDLHGKVAVVLVNDPDFENGKGDFGGKAMTYYGRWTYKYEEAARRGAAGVLVVHETAPASYGWATVKNSNTNALFDIVRDQPTSVHTQLEGWIQHDFAVSMFKQAGLDFAALKKQAQTRQFKPVPLKGETLGAKFKVDTRVITSHNVVGRIEGSAHPEQTVIYSAHWDHLGVGAPDASGDRIYNGAVDNATGSAALIELARAFARAPRPQRSVVFLSLTAEEQGLLGSEYYAANPLYPLATTVAVLNMDALDPTGPTRDFTISGSAKLGLLDDLVAAAKALHMSYTPDAHPEAGYFFRSDHFSFAKRGVPAVSFGSGEDMVDGGVKAGAAAAADYTAHRYHQPGDEWQASWSFTGMAHDLQLLYAVGSKLANSQEWPNWGAGSEFRATRDASAAARR
ncbi:MAG TPA: M28 family metallopeptidase [Rhodanobacteraceae bacterium]|nr:M28 family metallopeptidase [Rhodanobacteraceae bacterium]